PLTRPSVRRPGLGRPGRPGLGRPGLRRPFRPDFIRGRDGRSFSRSGYLSRYGTRFGRYWGYRGSWHNHWTRRWFSPGWRTWCFYDPCTTGWYYWCGARTMYLPVACMTDYPPTAGEDYSPGNADLPAPDEEEGTPDLPAAPM
ncbi:MAG: hypothetical protein K2W96_18975, partial [Gemmataceae bacterium]|nr:hypothetical protein [Gemmataceae bacterium]